MNYKQSEALPGFRFGLRSLLLLVTVFCLIAGMFWFVSLVFLLLAGVLLTQCVFFLLVQRLVNRIAGDPNSNPHAEGRDEIGR